MSKKNPFDSLLDQIVQMVEKIRGSKIVDLDEDNLAFISRHLDMIEKNVEIFGRIAEDAAKNIEAEPEEQKSAREKRFFRRARSIRKDLVGIKRKYSAFRRREGLKQKRSRLTGRKRKKKFKRLGGEEGWLPL